MRFASFPVCALACAWTLLGACKTTQGREDEAPKTWEVEILRGAQHVGTDPVTNWPPPLGACVETQFTVKDLPVDETTGKPASEVLLAFRHAGEPKGSIEINGTQVFSRVTAVDRFASAFGDLIAEVTVCAIASAFPGDPDCEPVEVPIETTFVGRRFSADVLVLGTNSARVCATAGDFLLADGLRLTEASSQGDAGAERDAEGEGDPDAADGGSDAAR